MPFAIVTVVRRSRRQVDVDIEGAAPAPGLWDVEPLAGFAIGWRLCSTGSTIDQAIADDSGQELWDAQGRLAEIDSW
jgi:hypothetical protein